MFLVLADGRFDATAILLLIAATVPAGAAMWLCHLIVVGRSCSLRRRLFTVLLSLVAPAAWVCAVVAWYG